MHTALGICTNFPYSWIYICDFQCHNLSKSLSSYFLPMHLACLLFSLILQSFATSNPGLICLLRFSGKASRQPLLCPAFWVRWNRGKCIYQPFSFPPGRLEQRHIVFWDQFALLPLNQGPGRHTGTTSWRPRDHCRESESTSGLSSCFSVTLIHSTWLPWLFPEFQKVNSDSLC